MASMIQKCRSLRALKACLAEGTDCLTPFAFEAAGGTGDAVGIRCAFCSPSSTFTLGLPRALGYAFQGKPAFLQAAEHGLSA
jgi:hypothetical protein